MPSRCLTPVRCSAGPSTAAGGRWPGRFAAAATLALLVTAGGPALAAARASKPSAEPAKKAPAEMGEEDLYRTGKELLERGKESDARTYLRRYEQRFPKGPHIEEVKLLIADSYFRASEIDQQVEGVALYRQFLTFYPQHPLACKAQLRLGEYHFRQMRSCDRDQAETRQAVEELQKLLAAYPDCPDADSARKRLEQAYDRLACAELKVVEFYRRTGEPRAASHRLADLLRDYPRFPQRCRAHRLQVELLEELALLDEARAELARMESECPDGHDLAEARRRMGMSPPKAPRSKSERKLDPATDAGQAAAGSAPGAR